MGRSLGGVLALTLSALKASAAPFGVIFVVFLVFLHVFLKICIGVATPIDLKGQLLQGHDPDRAGGPDPVNITEYSLI